MPTPAGPDSAAHIAQNAATSTNPNFDVCGYAILPCPVHSFVGQNSTKSPGPGSPDATGPEMAIASNPTYVMEGNNNIFSVYNFAGNTLYGPTSSYSFFAPLVHGTDLLGEPQMYWDGTRQHWIIVEEEIGVDVHNGVTASYYDIGVSKSQNAGVSAPSQWYLYQFANNVLLGLSYSWCDQPALGGDYWGLYLSCITFSNVDAVAGNVLFALSKNAVYSGAKTPVDYWTQIPSGSSCGTNCYWPAQNVSLANEDGTPDAEFVIAMDPDQNSSNNNGDITTVALTNTRALATGGTPTATYVTNLLPIFYSPPSPPLPGQKLYSSAGYGPKDVEYRGGNLYFAATAGALVNNQGVLGIYWAEIQPQLSPLDPTHPQNQTVLFPIFHQVAIWAYAAGVDAYNPTLITSSEGDETLVFNYSGTIAPGIAYTGRRAADAPDTLGDGGHSAIIVSGTNFGDPFTRENWSGYSGCSLDTNLTARGLVWCGGQYGGPHTSPSGSGWDTWIYALEVE